MRDEFVNQLETLAAKDPNLILITADLGFGIFDNFTALFPKQFINVGVAEQNMIGIATGLALAGKKVFTYSMANFATLRCIEQIRNDAAYHNSNVTIVASGGGFTYGSLGMSHHATEDIAIMRALPDVTVVAPCTAWEAFHATEQLCNTSSVCYLRIEKGGDITPPSKSTTYEIGKAIKYREGNDVTLIVTGGIMSEALKAANMLAKLNIDASVISMHTVKPIDREAIKEAVNQTRAIVTIEEHNIIGGLGSAVAEVLANYNLRTIFGQVSIQDKYTSVVGDQDYLRHHYQLDASAIVSKVHSLIDSLD
mgnify:CR=1 FL=1